MPSQVSVGCAGVAGWRLVSAPKLCPPVVSLDNKVTRSAAGCSTFFVGTYLHLTLTKKKKKKPVETNQYSWGDLLHLTEEQTCDVSSLQP